MGGRDCNDIYAKWSKAVSTTLNYRYRELKGSLGSVYLRGGHSSAHIIDADIFLGTTVILQYPIQRMGGCRLAEGKAGVNLADMGNCAFIFYKLWCVYLGGMGII